MCKGRGGTVVMGGVPPYLSTDEPHLNSSFQMKTKMLYHCLVTAVATRWQVQKSDSHLTGGQFLHRK